MFGFLESVKDLVSYTPRQSIMFRLNPLTKMFVAICVFSLSVLFSDPFANAVVFTVLLVALVGSGIPVHKELLRRREFFTLVAVISFFNLFMTTTYPRSVRYRSLGEVLVDVPWLSLKVTDFSLRYTIAVTFLWLNILLITILILRTTRMRDLQRAMERLGSPYVLSFAFGATLRFIPAVAEWFITVLNAQRSRGFEYERKGLLNFTKRLKLIFVPFLALNLKYARQIGVIMQSRGLDFENHHRTSLREITITRLDYSVLVLCTGITGASIIGYLFYGFGSLG